MIEWLDSAYPPNASQVAAAKAAGYGGWAGYFAGPNILNGWAQADFDRVKAGGLRTMAYCSGWADPTALASQGRAWAVTICLDDEPGIRAHGQWTQAWLDTAGGGQYGNYQYHAGVRAAFHILAAYPTSGDPAGVDWWSSTPRPAGLCGWQWAGSHGFAGITVDASWFDDGIAGTLHGGGTGQLGDEELLYVGPFHPLKATLKAYAAGNYFAQPFASLAPAGGVTVGATYQVDGYRWSNSPGTSHDPAAPGPDAAWWHVTTGGWVNDGILVTTGIAGAPGAAFPGAEPIEALYDAPSGRYLPVGGAAPAPVATPDDDAAYVLQSAYGKHTHRNDGADPASALTGTPV